MVSLRQGGKGANTAEWEGPPWELDPTVVVEFFLNFFSIINRPLATSLWDKKNSVATPDWGYITIQFTIHNSSEDLEVHYYQKKATG